MSLRVVGAGLPRTGTSSLKEALEHLLDGPCYHMREIPNHPYNLGVGWQTALAGEYPDWEELLAGYVATVDWPASMFWRDLSEANPDALVLLSVRDSPAQWHQSADQSILPYARMALAPEWREGRDFLTLLERFTGSRQWDNATTLKTAYERHNEAVRQSVPPQRLLEWRVTDGWTPLCEALGLPVPTTPFPWNNKDGVA